MNYFAELLLVGCLVRSYADEPERIVSGDQAEAGEFPYQIYLKYRRTYKCGGTLISDKHVLTAAHCVRGREAPYSGFVVVTGTIVLTRGKEHNIKAIYAHPGFIFNVESSYVHDIALITLEKPITINKFQKPIPIATTETPVGSTVRVSGWGRPGEHRPLSLLLMQLDTVVISESDCIEKIGRHIYPSQICTLAGRGFGACKGDSGGPLVHKNKLVGIVSWTNPCARGVPDIFTRVSYYQDFIREAMLKNDEEQDEPHT